MLHRLVSGVLVLIVLLPMLVLGYATLLLIVSG
jgi:hypothetical protein